MFRAICRVVALSSLLLGATSSLAGAQESAESKPPPVDEATPKEKDKPAANSVFLEGLGAGLFYSVNYERRVIDDLGVRAGFGYVSLTTSASAGGAEATSSASYLTIPITASYLGVRGRRSGLELGGGMTLAYTGAAASSGVVASSDSGMSAIGTAMVGYRLHPVDHAGFQFRVGVMALAAKGLSLSNPDPNAFGVLPWFYLSAGAGF
jgi:hypothetical protein